MASAGISSLPVKDDLDGDYTAFVDVLDVVAFVLREYSKGKSTDPGWEGWEKADWLSDPVDLEKRGAEFLLTPVKDVINLSRANPWCPVYSSGALLQLLEVFARGIHRVPVWSENLRKQVIGMVTQSDVLRHLVEPRFLMHKKDPQRSLLEPFANRTVKNLGFVDPGKPPITMSLHAPAIVACWLLHFHHVPAIAVTDGAGHLLANFSASDLKGLGSVAMPFTSLVQPLRSFLIMTGPRPALPPPITVTESTPFDVVLWKLTLYRVHRVWIVDTEQRPVGIISISDVMKLLASLA